MAGFGCPPRRALYKADYATAERLSREAMEVFGRGKYIAQSGRMSLWLADLNDLIGLKSDGWRWRQRAAQAAMESGSESLRTSSMAAAAFALLDGADYQAATPFLFGDDGLKDAVPRAMQAQVFLRQAEAALDAHDRIAARTAYDAAAEIVKAETNFRVARVQPELDLVLARLAWIERRFDVAEAAVDEVLKSVGPERGVLRFKAHLERARIRADVGLKTTAAEQDLRDAIKSFPPVATDRVPNDSGLWRRAFLVAATVICTNKDLQGLKGLAIIEALQRTRSPRPVGTDVVSEASLDAEIARLPADTVAIRFVFGPTSLLVWAIDKHGISFRERAVTPKDVQRPGDQACD